MIGIASALVDPAALRTFGLSRRLANPSQVEFAAVLESVKNSYRSTRAVVKKFNLSGVHIPPAVDFILGEVETLEVYLLSNVFKVSTQTFAKAENYHVASILSGDKINRV